MQLHPPTARIRGPCRAVARRVGKIRAPLREYLESRMQELEGKETDSTRIIHDSAASTVSFPFLASSVTERRSFPEANVRRIRRHDFFAVLHARPSIPADFPPRLFSSSAVPPYRSLDRPAFSPRKGSPSSDSTGFVFSTVSLFVTIFFPFFFPTATLGPNDRWITRCHRAGRSIVSGPRIR